MSKKFEKYEWLKNHCFNDSHGNLQIPFEEAVLIIEDIVNKKHWTDGRDCWCNPKIEKVNHS